MGTYIILILYKTPLLATGDKIMRNIKNLTLLGLMLFALAPLAFADYHYASHSGSNEFPYTSWETASDSITAAMRAADPYDTVYIGAGDYNEIIRAFNEDTCLTFIGAGIDSTRVWQDSLPNTWIARDKTLVRDIHFDSNNNRNGFGGYIGSSITVLHCKFTDEVSIITAGESTIIEDCEFYDVGGALDILATYNLVFRNNYIKTSRGTEIISHSWLRFAVIENNIVINDSDIYPIFNLITERTDSTIFRNNYLDRMFRGFNASGPLSATIENNTTNITYPELSGFIIQYLSGESGNISLKNNAITETNTGIFGSLGNSSQTHLEIKYNGFWGNVQNFQLSSWVNVDTFLNIEAYPMYLNPDSFDVRLQANSPLIDAGDPNILDVDSTRSDIGCYGGPGGSSYEYQDLPPRKPDSLAYQIRSDTIVVRWRLNYEADFNRYIVWRDTIPSFTPWAGNIITEPDTNLLYDINWDNNHDYYYRIAAYDNQWNMSEISDELVVLISGTDRDNSGVEIPNITSIASNYPNPFNSSTTIAYSVANLGPIPAQINIDIYDIQGRKIRSLLNNRMEVGKHTITWDGRDDSGNELASGIYFAKITQWHVDYLSRSQKLILVR
jgi:hypothetical protein